MSAIHYFQRYSQPENVATNNTLLLFSRLYHLSLSKFSQFINGLLDDADLQTGVQFSQQVAGKKSIPDGVIAQESFRILIETKLHTNFSKDQIKGHLSGFNNEQRQILLTLSPQKIYDERRKEIEDVIQEETNSSVKLICTTFQVVIDLFESLLNEYDFELKEIIRDYEGYCIQSNLLDNSGYTMRVVPCTRSHELNIVHNLYFAPASRGFSTHKYIGLYFNQNSEKGVFHIGKLTNVITANLGQAQSLDIINSTDNPTEKQITSIKNCIEEVPKKLNWSIENGHTFFCVDKFVPTEYLKVSKYGMQGTRLMNLKTILGTVPSDIEAIASELRSRTWPSS